MPTQAPSQDPDSELAQPASLETLSVEALKVELVRALRERDAAVAGQQMLQRRLVGLLQALPAGVILIDRHGRVREANPVAQQLLAAPLVGILWRDVIARDFAPRDDDGHEVSTRSGRRLSIAMCSLDGEPGQLLLLTDLTQTRQLQAQAAHHQRLSALGQMVASLAHQVRTPLSAALLYASHLTEKNLNAEQQKRFAGRIKDRLHELERQVRDMLIFAKGDLPLGDQISPQQLMRGLKASAEVVLNRHLVRWQCDVFKGAVLCNQDTLIGALTNLIENAVQAGGAQVRLKVHLFQRAQLLHVAISDDGPGIAPDILARLGEPFVTTKTTGTGLGLPVVKAVMAAHRGAFKVRSRQGFGTCVTVILPMLATLREEQ